ncbi:MAG: hypothetical protein R3A44_30745 [Caldilineaceae bacterium]
MTKDQRKGGNIFQLYSGKASQNDSMDSTDSGFYYAYGLEKSGAERGEEEWIFFCHGPQAHSDMIRYDNIQRIYVPDVSLVTLILDNEAFYIQGRFVDQILLPFQNRRLRSLYVFDPAWHTEPPAGETKITRIDRYTREDFQRGLEPPEL